MDTPDQLTHISLCTGYAGIDKGLGRIIPTLRTIAYVEIEAVVCANLVSKMEANQMDVAPIWTNLKTFPWEQFRGRVGLLSGGFPCQPFSSAGARRGSEDSRHLWPDIAKGIRILKPPIVFLENVEGIFSSKLKGDHWNDPEGTPVALHVIRELERMGYSAEAGTFSAAEVGAPHLRKRAFFLAICNRERSGQREKLIREIRRALEGRGQTVSKGRVSEDLRPGSTSTSHKWPARRGQPQHSWEPRRTVPRKR